MYSIIILAGTGLIVLALTAIKSAFRLKKSGAMPSVKTLSRVIDVFIAAAKETGFSFKRRKNRIELSGNYDNHRVFIEGFNFNSDFPDKIRVEISADSVNFWDLTIRKKKRYRTGNIRYERSARENTETGDLSFDRMANAYGTSPDHVRALLTAEARRIIADLINRHQLEFLTWLVNPGRKLMMTFSASQLYNPSEIRGLTETGLKLIREFIRYSNLELALKYGFYKETHIPVKEKYLESFGYIRKGLKISDEIIQDALAFGSDDLKFAAAINLGPEGYQYFSELLMGNNQAVLVKILKYARVKKIAELSSMIVEAAARSVYRGEKLEFVKYFSEIRESKAENFIQSAVNGPEDKVCIEALGKCGTYKSIAFLDELRQERPSRTIDRAISDIQCRIGVGDEGWLSTGTADSSEGTLSVADKNNVKESGE